MINIKPEILLNGLQQPAIILNEATEVTYVNDAFLIKAKLNRNDFPGAEIKHYFKNFPKRNLLEETVKTNGFYRINNLIGMFAEENSFSLYITPSGNNGYLVLLTPENEDNSLIFSMFFENSSDCKLILDFNTLNIVEVNKSASATFGYSKSDLKKKNINTLVDGDGFSIADFLSDEFTAPVLRSLTDFEEKTFPAEISFDVIEIDGNKFICCSIKDVTEKINAQELLKESEERLVTLVNSTPDMICIKDGEGRWTLANNADLNLFGFTMEDCIGKTDKELAEKYSKHRRAFIGCVDSDEAAWQLRTTSRGDEHITGIDGVKKVYDVIKVPVFNDDGSRKALIVFGRDITQRKQIEQDYKAVAESYQNIYENVPIGLYRATLDGTPLMANKSFLDILGFDSFEEFSKLKLSDLYVNPAYRHRLIELSMDTDKIRGYETEFYTRKGGIIVVRLNVHVMRDDDDNILWLEGVLEDISNKKRTENILVEAKEEAEKSEKLKSEFLAQMSHEIRTPINSMLNSIGLIKEELNRKINEEIESCFGIIDRSSHRIIRTIDSILNMSEIQTGTYEYKRKEIDLKELVLDPICFEYQPVAVAKNIEFSLNVYTDETLVKADEYSLKQVFINLIDNAVKFTNSGSVNINVYRNENKFLIVEVKDTGVGISEEYLPSLFKPFSQEEQGYTRKYEGNGLGLALVSKFCEFNNASISVSSEKSVGTVFRVNLNQ